MALDAESPPGRQDGSQEIAEEDRTRAHLPLALEPPRVVRPRRFDDPAHEWRRLFSELLGTFFLVLVAAGGAVVNAQSGGQISRTAAVTAPGLMVTAIILFMGAVSGAHLNPAVSVAFAARGDFPWWRVPGYIVVRLPGPPSRASCSGPSWEGSADSGRPRRARGSRTSRR